MDDRRITGVGAAVNWCAKVNRRPPAEADIAAYFAITPPSQFGR